jgi:hypothetical protein
MNLPQDVMVYILVAGFAATAIWRLAGLALSGGIAEDGRIIALAKAVSTALVAGLISRIVVFPPGVLADVSLLVRLGAFGIGVAVFFLARRHMGAGILAGTAALRASHLVGV